MHAITSAPKLMGRRLAGASLYALMVTAVALPVVFGVAGLIVGPQPLRAKVVITIGDFAAFHGRTGLFLVMLATFAAFTLYNLAVGPRRRYGWSWELSPRMFDDNLSASEKLAVVLTSGIGCLLLAIDVGWLLLAALMPI